MAHNSGDDRYSVTIVDIDDPAAASAGSELFDLHAVQLQQRDLERGSTAREGGAAASESFADLFRTKKRAEVSPGVSPDGR